MTAMEAIGAADKLYPNIYNVSTKYAWLEQLENMIRTEILLRYDAEAPEIEPFAAGEGERELLVGAPYDEMYIFWLTAKMHYFLREDEAFNDANAMFESMFKGYRNEYNRTHMPLTAKKKYLT